MGSEEVATISVGDYHRRSKHRLEGYARGPETIDWDRQPDPFRRFEGAPLIELPLQRFAGGESGNVMSLDLNGVLQPATDMRVACSLQSVALWLEHSLALTAWKQHGSARWSLRCNPSSGNLHPTEAYLVVAGIDELPDGVYHYRADLHALEQRCLFARSLATTTPVIFVGLSSVHWREAWKYGERAYRYCQLDIGHAVAALDYGAALNGWRLCPETIADAELDTLLGVDRCQDFIEREEEWADCLLRVELGADIDNPVPALDLVLAAGAGQWQGSAAVLDKRHFYNWPIITSVAQQVRRGEPTVEPCSESQSASAWPQALPGDYRDNLSRLIRQRRSAQAFDGYTTVPGEQFFVMLDHLLPRAELTPWSALPPHSAMHCVLFVHRVEGLAPGLYALPRSASGEALMREQLRPQFLWQRVESAPSHLPLYLLIQARAERTASKLSCQQAIAGDSAFSLVMLAEFADSIEDAPWRYRELFWEAGALGQALYLEAEGIGLQGTGIGCFFDDPVHDLLGIGTEKLQSLYHFTVGGALRDSRIISLPPYSQERRRS